MTRPGIEPMFPGPLANTLTSEPMSNTKLRENYQYSIGILETKQKIFNGHICLKQGNCIRILGTLLPCADYLSK